MATERVRCAECPTNPRCSDCPDAPTMRAGRPVVAVQVVRKVRPVLDRSKMGYGNHAYEFIDPATIPTDFAHPEGAPRRDFNNAFNRAHEDTNVDLDTLSRTGTVISTDAPGYEGEWEVLRMPLFTKGVVYARVGRPGTGVEQSISTVELGVVAGRESNQYTNTVITKLISGGRANKSTRVALTQAD